MNLPAASSPRPPAYSTGPASSHTATAGDPERKKDSDRSASVLSAALCTKPAVAVQPPGRDISRWSCQLLELVFCHLETIDLAHAGQTCRQWYQAASDHRLQAQCFMRAYPLRYRQYLQQTLDPALARQCLSLWCQQLPEDSWQRDKLEYLLGERLAPCQLFHEMTRQMLSAERILATGGNLSLRCALPSACSPDGNYLVTEVSPPDTEPTPSLSVWRQGTCGLHRTGLCHLGNLNVWEGLTFSADSRRLLVVSRDGLLQTWQLQADGSWQLSISQRLCDETVFMAKFSPDAHWLVLQIDTRLQMFGETRAWQECSDWEWVNVQPSWVPAYSPHDTADFSRDSRHFLFVHNGEALVFDRQNTGWQAQRLNRGTPLTTYGEGVLSPSSDWVALSLSCRDTRHRLINSYILELWQRHETQPHWRFSSERMFSGAHYSQPCVAFRHDGRQLVAADRLCNGHLCLAVLSLTQDGNWVTACQLQLGPAVVTTPSYGDIHSASFSAQGLYLAAAADAGVQIWRCHAGTWKPVAWIEAPDPASNGSSPECRFSPDGWHCAVSTGDEGCVSIHGPGPGGKYISKMRVIEGACVCRMQFSPDGLRLLVASRYAHEFDYHNRTSLLYLAPALSRAGTS
ncbi:MAG: F-box/WD40 repeat-containing protein [Kistimonas sp.]|nr:F-box/WD40 repeat-containing protein [Kistimonas sp.]